MSSVVCILLYEVKTGLINIFKFILLNIYYIEYAFFTIHIKLLVLVFINLVYLIINLIYGNFKKLKILNRNITIHCKVMWKKNFKHHIIFLKLFIFFELCNSFFTELCFKCSNAIHHYIAYYAINIYAITVMVMDMHFELYNKLRFKFLILKFLFVTT